MKSRKDLIKIQTSSACRMEPRGLLQPPPLCKLLPPVFQAQLKGGPGKQTPIAPKQTFLCWKYFHLMQIRPQESTRQQAAANARAAVPALGNRNLLGKEILAKSDFRAKHGFTGACSHLCLRRPRAGGVTSIRHLSHAAL